METPFSVADFDVGAGGATDFALGEDINSTQFIEVHVNGREQREGGSNDWTRDITNDKIIFNFTVPENAWVRIRVYG